MIEQIGFGLPESGEQGFAETVPADDDAVELSGVCAGTEPELEVPLLSEPGPEKGTQFDEFMLTPFRYSHGGCPGWL